MLWKKQKHDAFSALVAVLAEAIIVHIYAMVDVPVFTSQAIVGAVLGIGFHKGVKTISGRAVLGSDGVGTHPVAACAVAYGVAWLLL